MIHRVTRVLQGWAVYEQTLTPQGTESIKA